MVNKMADVRVEDVSWRTNDCEMDGESEDFETIGLVDQNEKIGRIQHTKIDEVEKSSQHTWRYVPGLGFRRYKNALENTIPVRRKNRKPGANPIDSAGLFSFAFYTWISKYVYRSYKNGFQPEEWPSLSPLDGSDLNAERLELLWRDELKRRGAENASFGKVVWRFIRTRFIVAFVVFAVCCLCGFFSQALMMQRLLEHIQSSEGAYEDGIKWALLFILGEILRWFLYSLFSAVAYKTAARLKSACMVLLYKKVIRMNHLGDTSTGQLINIFTNDCQRIFEMIVSGSFIVGAPVLTICGIWYMIEVLGPMSVVGMLIFFIYLPVQYVLVRISGYIRSKNVKVTDTRIRLTAEVLECIRLIKLYAWEKRFFDVIFDVRKQELHYGFANLYCLTMNVALLQTLPVLATIVTIVVYLSTGSSLTASQAFPISTFFSSQMIPNLLRVRASLQSFIDCSIAFRRIKRVLIQEDDSIVVLKPIMKSQAVAISQGTFACQASSNAKANGYNNRSRKNKHVPVRDVKEIGKKGKEAASDVKRINILFDINFEATKGKLIGICGQVGSGKSSLLLAALGQLPTIGGQVMRDGSCAYVSQQAWIENATLRDNILFGKSLDPERYKRVLYACSLTYDLGSLPGGDMTEIGEKGINLSGGQKQRVALARALYADRDIYFLDDPLSAVDAHVGLHIFNNLITGALRSKTVLFVTHQIHYLNRCDDVYMMSDGRIVQHGTHTELMELNKEYAAMVNSISNSSADPSDNTVAGSVSFNEANQPPGQSDKAVLNGSPKINHSRRNADGELSKKKTTLIEAEKKQEGTITGATYACYIKAAGGWCSLFLILLLTLVYCACLTFNSWWLAEWLNAGGGNTTDLETNATIVSGNINDNPNFSYYQTIYGGAMIFILLSSFVQSFAFCKFCQSASKNLHKKLFKKIMCSTMRFFDTTPTGRMQNLFSRDTDEVDNLLPVEMNFILICLFQNILAGIIICMIFPWILLPILLLIVAQYFVCKIFTTSLRGLKRMESMSRSPCLSHLTATINGLNTIHAFEKDEDFESTFSKLVEKNTSYLFMVLAVSKWLGVRVDGLTALMPCIIALLIAILRDQVPSASAGLALSYASFVASIFQYVVRLIPDAQTRFISIERMNQYMTLTQTEGDNGKALTKVKPNWPSTPLIEFDKVYMSYGKDTPLVLNGVSFAVDPREKIGIVGRTGSGKSSLTVALFRLVELSEGKITIDDVDISEVGLERLRSRLSIIPQEPILFSGTIRSNLDPFKTNSDSEIWEALEKTKLKDRVQSIAGQLDATVGFGGDNLSVGERQLLCLARALLRHTTILVLDEATAAVDPETETVVQSTIQQAFVGSTVLTIAHRLQTVVTCDRILVMDDGKVAEFDTPSNLLANKDSHFSKMMKAAEDATK